MSRRSLALCLIAPLLAWGCGDRPEKKGAWKSAILITVDTLRADRLGCYGYEKDTSPNLDALARGATRFERALVSIPRTTQSLASILTGRTPASHGVRYLHHRLPQEEVTVAERFEAAGFRTGAVMVVPFFGNKMGFGQGFGDDFEKFRPNEDARADAVTDAALAWLEKQGDQPFFLWVHYRDPHAPYYPPKRFRDKLDPGYEGDLDVFHYWPVDDAGMPLPGSTEAERTAMKGERKFGEVPYDDETARRARALYDGEIAFVDEQIGRLVAALDRRGTRDETVIAVTADHGESLGEHDFWFDHGEFLYDACLRVPLIVSAPGISPSAVPAQVAAIDLTPTLLDLFGLDPIPGANGSSLHGHMIGATADDHGVLAESGEPLMWERNPRFRHLSGEPEEPAGRLRAECRDRGIKAIYDPLAPPDRSIEFYRPPTDPGEAHDLAGDPRAKNAVEEALRVLRGVVAIDRGEPPPQMSPEEEERLRQAGYVR